MRLAASLRPKAAPAGGGLRRKGAEAESPTTAATASTLQEQGFVGCVCVFVVYVVLGTLVFFFALLLLCLMFVFLPLSCGGQPFLIQLHKWHWSRGPPRFSPFSALPVQLSIRFMLRSFFAAIRSTFGTSGQNKVSKNGLRSVFCTPYAVFLAPAKMPRIFRVFIFAALRSTFGTFSEIVLLPFSSCFACPPGARHKPPGARSHHLCWPLLGPKLGSGRSIFAGMRSVFATSPQKQPR